MAGEFLSQWMKIPSRDIHSSWVCGSIQRGRLVTQPVSVGSVDSCLRAVRKSLSSPACLNDLITPMLYR
jgi:hypothetical protein